MVSLANARVIAMMANLKVFYFLLSTADVDSKDFAVVIVNARINSRSQNAAMSKRISVCRRRVKIVHLKLFSVHRDHISFGMSGGRLLMENLNRPFDNLILFLSIRAHQTVNVAEHVREIVQINPEQTPN